MLELGYPSVVTPGHDFASIREAVMQIKEAVEMLTGQRRGQQSVGNLSREVEGLASRASTLQEIGPQLAQLVDQVEARVNDTTATGRVVIGAGALPSGYKAMFEVGVRGNDGSPHYGALRLGLRNDNTSEVFIDTDKLILRDPTAVHGAPFSYSGGLFELTGDVKVSGSLFVDGTVDANKYADLSLQPEKIDYNALTTMFFGGVAGTDFTTVNTSGYATFASLGVAAPANSVVVLNCRWDGRYYAGAGGGGLTTYRRDVRLIDSLGNQWVEFIDPSWFGFSNNVNNPATNFTSKVFSGITDRTFSWQVRVVLTSGSPTSSRVQIDGQFIEALVRKR